MLVSFISRLLNISPVKSLRYRTKRMLRLQNNLSFNEYNYCTLFYCAKDKGCLKLHSIVNGLIRRDRERARNRDMKFIPVVACRLDRDKGLEADRVAWEETRAVWELAENRGRISCEHRGRCETDNRHGRTDQRSSRYYRKARIIYAGGKTSATEKVRSREQRREKSEHWIIAAGETSS